MSSVGEFQSLGQQLEKICLHLTLVLQANFLKKTAIALSECKDEKDPLYIYITWYHAIQCFVSFVCKK